MAVLAVAMDALKGGADLRHGVVEPHIAVVPGGHGVQQLRKVTIINVCFLWDRERKEVNYLNLLEDKREKHSAEMSRV